MHSDTSNEDYIGQANDVSMGQWDNYDDTHTDEQDWRTILGKRLHHLSYVDVSCIEFKSMADGDDFYNAYVKFVGFSVRKDDVKRDKNNIVISRRWVCAKEGFRKIKHKETMIVNAIQNRLLDVVAWLLSVWSTIKSQMNGRL